MFRASASVTVVDPVEAPEPTVLPEIPEIRERAGGSGCDVKRNSAGRAQNIDAEVQGFRPVHIGKPDFEKDLLLLRRDLNVQEIDDLAERGTDRLGTLRGKYVFDGAGEINGSGIAGNLNAVSEFIPDLLSRGVEFGP